jgi:hypothetical protein
MLGAASASGHETSFPTMIFLDDLTIVGDDLLFSGHVESPRNGCLPRRTVELHAVFTGGSEFIDRGRTSENGFYGVGGAFDSGGGAFNWRIRVLRKDIGGHDHTHICKSDKLIVD